MASNSRSFGMAFGSGAISIFVCVCARAIHWFPIRSFRLIVLCIF